MKQKAESVEHGERGKTVIRYSLHAGNLRPES